ncbi:GNAT family N-acetyltransferase [Halobacteriovorax sp. HLS]|uniref:GNAT family N-acetyltransferase n=1 Tax=Halobacteriovorax sp. HLS TaxID=2234000 RepID=UPI000FD8E26C|nr:GNAT family N-acetyltransferase [Halobacteriovorax sp. HLS]
MKKITLRHLTPEDKEKFIKANSADWGDFAFAHYWESLAQENFDTFIRIVPEFSRGMHIPKDHVPCTFLFVFNEENELVGRTSIRHELTEFLLKAGGHVGYGVVPEFRRRGYASAILNESLNYIRNNISEIDRVLVTCDEGNIGSQRTIENNKGILEDIIEMPNGPRKMRFWIQL